MQPYHDQPQYAYHIPSTSIINTPHRDQRAFILNCDEHWFTLRRFGDSGVGPWFNLDSSLGRPEWVSETYLGIWLQQAEADGNILCGSSP
jgi:ataxin-3